MNTPFYIDPDPSPEDGARHPTDSDAAMWEELKDYLELNFPDATTTESYRLSDFLEFEDGSAVENDYDNQNERPDLVTRYEKEK
jgi:hypothetical protein